MKIKLGRKLIVGVALVAVTTVVAVAAGHGVDGGAAYHHFSALAHVRTWHF